VRTNSRLFWGQIYFDVQNSQKTSVYYLPCATKLHLAVSMKLKKKKKTKSKFSKEKKRKKKKRKRKNEIQKKNSA
jgi:hypothetical protein